MQVCMRLLVCEHRCTIVKMSVRVHAGECVYAPGVFSVRLCIDLCLCFHVHLHRHKGDSKLGCGWRCVYVDL